MNSEIWGLSGTLATERDEQLLFANERFWHWSNDVDEACNRFRSGSEISRANALGGKTTPISSTFKRALGSALLEGSWAITIGDSLRIAGHEPRMSPCHGGVATPSSTTRTWTFNGRSSIT